ncbi:hypothetical protein QQX98_012343 [Neonectria punicea]|uniref:Uncharacterized protein n=1 Tax=Neonectria punicea TaxID=979145 RepID=A0ABR1GJJ0_9HYPO
MVSVCAGLVTVDNESGVIRLVHYTTQEYLKRTRERWFQDPECVIMTTCITYLSFIVFETGFCETDDEFKERLRSHPFYDYAAHNWGLHAPEDWTPSQELISFLESKAKVEASSQALMACKFGPNSFDSSLVLRNFTGLHLAGYFGVSKAAERLLELGYSPDLEDSGSRTPLWYAAKNGHKTVVTLLVAVGADVDAVDKLSGRTAIQLAAGRGYLEVVKRLLAAGADVNTAAEEHGRTALQAAAEGGHLAVVERLLEAGADVNAAAARLDERTAPQAADRGGYLEVVESLLAVGAIRRFQKPLSETC